MSHENTSKEAELQGLLTDERERCNQHKQLYQTLKEEHGKLKDELTLVHLQLKDARLKNEQMQESKDNNIKKLEEQLREKQKDIVKLKDQVESYDPERIRELVYEEATNHYEVKIKDLHKESDKIKELYKTLQLEHTILKCNLGSRETEYSHSVERLTVQHLNEVERLQDKIKSLEKEKSFPDDSTSMELKSTKHEILQLNARLTGLLAECEELRAKNENLTVQLTSTNRTHLKQIADSMSSIRSLESEKQKAIRQKEVFEKELSNFQEQKRIINSELQSSRREIMSLKSKLEDCEHKCQMTTTDLQVENEHLKTQYQSEKEQLIDEITKLKSDFRNISMELEHTQQMFMSKEQELQQSSIYANQQLWKKSAEFQQEREMMEKKFQDFQRQKEQFISQLNEEIQILQHNLQLCSDSKLELEKEINSIKEKLEEASKHTDAVAAATALSTQNAALKKEIQELKEQISLLKSSSNVFLEEKDRLMNDILSQKINKNYDEERELLQMKLSWEQQKLQFHQRLADLESQLKETKTSSATERKELEQKIHRYSRAVNKLKDKLDHQKTKNEELESQREILEKNVPIEAHMQVRNKLTELQRRLEEYRLIVAAEPYFQTSARSATAPVSDKLLTDIKNLQLRLPSVGDADAEYEVFKVGREKTTDRTTQLHSKKSHPRRRSLKTRNRDQPSKTISPTITSSSDLDLENL